MNSDFLRVVWFVKCDVLCGVVSVMWPRYGSGQSTRPHTVNVNRAVGRV